MKKLKHFIPLLTICLLIGCSKEEANLKENKSPLVQINDNDAIPLDVSGFTFDNSVAESHSGCDDATESIGGSLKTCCNIHSLQYWGPPQWQPQVGYFLNGPNAWEATDWIRRRTLINNTTGDFVFDLYSSDPTYPDYACDEDLNFNQPLGLGPGGGIGPLCPNDFTFRITRYYEWLDSGIFVECCSKSIDVSLPVNPNLPPCA